MQDNLNKNTDNKMFVTIIGGSGVGKTTAMDKLVDELGEAMLGRILGTTTRKPRKKEKNGVDYIFIDDPLFESLINEGEMVEYTKVYGAYKGTNGQDIINKLSKSKVAIKDFNVAAGLESHNKVMAYLTKKDIACSGIKILMDIDDTLILDRFKTRAKDEEPNANEQDINKKAEKDYEERKGEIANERKFKDEKINEDYNNHINKILNLNYNYIIDTSKISPGEVAVQLYKYINRAYLKAYGVSLEPESTSFDLTFMQEQQVRR